MKGLLQDGCEGIFLGFGLPNPKTDPIFAGLSPENGFFTSKQYLPAVARASKPGERHGDKLLLCPRSASTAGNRSLAFISLN